MAVNLIWFRRDLRLHDHPALTAARARGAQVYAVFCLSELDALNARQRAFVIATLRLLRQTLDRLDASLTLLPGDAPVALSAAALRLGASHVYCTSAGGRERIAQDRAAQALRLKGIRLCTESGSLVHDPDAVADRKQAAGEGYRIFPPFYDAWKALPVVRPLPQTAPNARDADPGPLPSGALANIGVGESHAWDLLQRFLAGRAADYATNSEYPGRPATSELAPYLRFGVLSSRAVYHAVAERMSRSWTLAQERSSMEAFLRRLAQRDFFAQLAHYAPRMHDEPLQAKMRGFSWSHDAHFVRAWETGMTGYPFVDAAMRQLQAEGHVHQRAAVCAASFCVCDLGLDWRIGRDIWMRELLEADDAQCDGNWQHIAGIGSDQAAYPRIYNPVRQAQIFDSQATYVRRYCRELSRLPTQAALAPWRLERQQQTELGFFTPDQYPAPIVDHNLVARGFLARYQAYRNRSEQAGARAAESG
ncbi:MAG: hypothetical protein DLM53_08590 [Candidatus Eremiobacter antarcticus]|nr:deoxyribodipyrimidine photo-lyase [Candidatus Eremiobacteraeota bacterium]MBC5809114.1 deoxyribodipyrimidine photo-lyase [Candidatus Eremiobacteraeota bacterium]PZR61632.1 MAG: hypothetical protein DLM53_08590 [Candidatus Eremiobacter sp. RRmetagenome_bin22]